VVKENGRGFRIASAYMAGGAVCPTENDPTLAITDSCPAPHVESCTSGPQTSASSGRSPARRPDGIPPDRRRSTWARVRG
jgi:hypothetical protein